jgi:ABC-type bacteriocin/lantibiotic exporter with double-glycine peptidase domain
MKVHDNSKNIFLKSKVLEFPLQRQVYDYDCGIAALQSILGYYGYDVSEGELLNLLKISNEGTDPDTIIRGADEFDLKGELIENTTIEKIKELINQKSPVICLVQAWTDKENINWKKEWEAGHYVVAIGYNEKGLIFSDPSSMFKTFLTYSEFQDRWHDVSIDYQKKYLNSIIVITGEKPEFKKNYAIQMEYRLD